MSRAPRPTSPNSPRVPEIILSSDGTSEQAAFTGAVAALMDSLLSTGLPCSATITAGPIHGDFTVIRRDDHELVTSSLRRIPLTQITRLGVHTPWSTPSTISSGGGA